MVATSLIWRPLLHHPGCTVAMRTVAHAVSAHCTVRVVQYHWPSTMQPLVPMQASNQKRKRQKLLDLCAERYPEVEKRVLLSLIMQVLAMHSACVPGCVSLDTLHAPTGFSGILNGPATDSGNYVCQAQLHRLIGTSISSVQGKVLVGDVAEFKAGTLVPAAAQLRVKGLPGRWASRCLSSNLRHAGAASDVMLGPPSAEHLPAWSSPLLQECPLAHLCMLLYSLQQYVASSICTGSVGSH